MTIKKPFRGGPWVPLSTEYYEDEAIIAVGKDAELLYVRCLAFAGSAQRNGYVNAAQVQGRGRGLRSVRSSSAALVQTGLWVYDSERDGFSIRGWHKWNPSQGGIDAGRGRNGPTARRGAGKTSTKAEASTDVDVLGDETGAPEVEIDIEKKREAGRAPSGPARPASRAVSLPPDLSGLRAQFSAASRKIKAAGGRVNGYVPDGE